MKKISLSLLTAVLVVSILPMVINIRLVKANTIGSTLNLAILDDVVVDAGQRTSEWNQTYGGSDYEELRSMIQTNDGGYALAGYTTSFGAGMNDFWLVKTDAAGNMEWNQTYGGTGDEYASSVVQTSDGDYVLAGWTYSFGAGSSDSWLVKTDANGNMQWNKTYGGTNDDEAYSVVQTNDGGYALAGETYSFGAGSGDFWLVKTDGSGNAQWKKTYGGTGWDKARSLVQTSDGGYVLAGFTHSFGAGSGDFWLVKTDANGNMQWSKTFGGTNEDTAFSVVQTSDGGYALVGWRSSFDEGYTRPWLVKTNANGAMQWNKTYGGADIDVAYSVVQTNDGGYALAGYTTSFGAGMNDFWLVKTDAAGNMEWNQTYGGTGDDWAYALVQTDDGGYTLAGSTTSFGAGGADFWLVNIFFGGFNISSSISISTNCASTYVGYKVNVTGTLMDMYNIPLSNETVVLYYTFSGITTWTPITSDKTDSSGKYSATWIPPATGNFIIKAEWAGNATHSETDNTVALSSLSYENQHVFSVESNSTISGLTFDQNTGKLSFGVSGANGTTGYTRVTIAKSLIMDVTKIRILVDGLECNYTVTELNDSWVLLFRYNHSDHQVEVGLQAAIPEFPSFYLVAFFMIGPLLAAVAYKKRHFENRASDSCHSCSAEKP